MVAKASSVSFIGAMRTGASGNLTQSSQRAQGEQSNGRLMTDSRAEMRQGKLEDVFLAAKISEGADIGDDESRGKAILRADLAEIDAAVLESEAAAAAVVADLHELALQGLVGEIVAQARSEIETLASQASIAEEGADLIRKRLLKRNKPWRNRVGQVSGNGVVVQAEVSNRREEFTVGLHFQKGADGDQALDLRVVLKDLFEIIEAARSDLEVADDGRPIARAEGESKGRDGIERLQDVPLAFQDGAAEGGVKVMLLQNAPGDKLLRLIIACLGKEALREAIFDFIGVGQRRIGIEADELGEVVHAGDITIIDDRLDGVFEALAGLVLVGGSTFEETFECRRAQFD